MSILRWLKRVKSVSYCSHEKANGSPEDSHNFPDNRLKSKHVVSISCVTWSTVSLLCHTRVEIHPEPSAMACKSGRNPCKAASPWMKEKKLSSTWNLLSRDTVCKYYCLKIILCTNKNLHIKSGLTVNTFSGNYYGKFWVICSLI